MSGPKRNVVVTSPCRVKSPTTIPSLRTNLSLLDRGQAQSHGTSGQASDYERPSANPFCRSLYALFHLQLPSWRHFDPNQLLSLSRDHILSSCRRQSLGPSGTPLHLTLLGVGTKRVSPVPVRSSGVLSPTDGPMTMTPFGHLSRLVMAHYDHSHSPSELVRPLREMEPTALAEEKVCGADGVGVSLASLAAVRVAVAV